MSLLIQLTNTSGRHVHVEPDHITHLAAHFSTTAEPKTHLHVASGASFTVLYVQESPLAIAALRKHALNPSAPPAAVAVAVVPGSLTRATESRNDASGKAPTYSIVYLDATGNASPYSAALFHKS